MSGPRPFHVMLKPRGAVCNLACAYCFYLEKRRLYPDGSHRMSEEVLRAFTRQYLVAQPFPEVTFSWQGGEPTLMGVPFFERAVELQHRHRRPGQETRNTIQTNGVLLDDEWGRFLAHHGFLVGVSLDGPRDLHDRYRVDKNGEPTFEHVRAGLEILRRHGVETNLLCCVHAGNAEEPLAVYRFLRDEVGARFLQFIPVVEREGDRCSERSVTASGWGSFLRAVFDEWVQRDVGEVFVQHFDAALGAFSGLDHPYCVHAPVCGDALVLEHNGDLYSCDHFVDPDHRLGNILETPLAELATGEKQRRFGRDKRDRLPRACRECDVLFACHGGCPRNRFAATPDGELHGNVLCEGLGAFFRHIAEPMRFMAAELQAGRSPASVMDRRFW